MSSTPRTYLFVDGINATLAGFANFSALSFLARLSTSVRAPRLVPFTFSLSAELRVSYEF